MKLKSNKLIHNVKSNIHIYLDSENGMELASRLSYVKRMVSHPEVKRAMPYYVRDNYSSLGAYDKTILLFMQWRFIWGLYIVTGYSRFRNRKYRRIPA